MIRGILFRLFVIVPVSLLLMLLFLTFIIPFLFWVLTGQGYAEWAISLVENLNSRFDL